MKTPVERETPQRAGHRGGRASALPAPVDEAARRVMRDILVEEVEVGAPHDAAEREADALARRAVPPAAPSVHPAATAADAVRPLDAALRPSLEGLLGASLGDVRVHEGPRADAANRSLGARAFTLGRDIWLGASESAGDLPLLAHEAAHVVQGEPRTLRRKTGDAPAEGQSSGSAQMLHSTGDELAAVVHIQYGRSIEQWRSFLKNADESDRALELNIFLALATGHTDYIRTGDETVVIRPWPEPSERGPAIRAPGPAPKPIERSLQGLRREHLQGLPRPSEEASTRLMVALISTRGIDLREIGALSPALGYLLREFTRMWYPVAVRFVAGKVGEVGGIAAWQVDPAAIDDFLGQAEGAFSDTRDLEEKRHESYDRGGLPHTTVTPSRLKEIGVVEEKAVRASARAGVSGAADALPHPQRALPSEEIAAVGKKAGPAPTEMLQASALAGANLAATAAIGAAADPKRTQPWGEIAERCKREIAQHARVLSGIASRKDRLDAIDKALMEMAFAALTAGMGAYLGELKAFGAARLGTLGLPPEVYVAAAVDASQAGASAMSSRLVGLSGAELRASFREGFAINVQEQVNLVRDHLKGDQIDAVVAVAGHLESAFLYQSTG